MTMHNISLSEDEIRAVGEVLAAREEFIYSAMRPGVSGGTHQWRSPAYQSALDKLNGALPLD